ncbi:response regulator [Falsiroseomonas sp. HW251]|uniref:response regulator n=1 Tax=Falsiroseomonas sp. HW251 TaxID=3390998 RepID=UPI003D31CB4E
MLVVTSAAKANARAHGGEVLLRMAAANSIDILLVEDDPLVRDVLLEALTDAGLEVMPVGTAEDGLDALDRQGQPLPAAVVADVNLGPGIDGVALAEEVCRRWPSVAVVVMTGDDRSVDGLPDALRKNCLVKPFELEQLVAAVKTRIRR